MNDTITVDESHFLNHSTMFGTDAVLHKVGRKWTVGYSTCQHPEIFKTKKAAYEAAENFAHAISLRKYNNNK